MRALASLLAIVPAGVLRFSTRPQAFFMHRIFQLKLLLIALAVLNSLSFHLGVYRTAAACNAAHLPWRGCRQ